MLGIAISLTLFFAASAYAVAALGIRMSEETRLRYMIDTLIIILLVVVGFCNALVLMLLVAA